MRVRPRSSLIEGLVVVGTIDGAVVHQAADAAKADEAEVSVERGSGGEQGKVGPAAAVDGKVFDGRVADVAGEIGLRGIDRRSFIAHFDDLVSRGHREWNLDLGDAPDLDGDAQHLEIGEAAAGGFQQSSRRA